MVRKINKKKEEIDTFIYVIVFVCSGGVYSDNL